GGGGGGGGTVLEGGGIGGGGAVSGGTISDGDGDGGAVVGGGAGVGATGGVGEVDVGGSGGPVGPGGGDGFGEGAGSGPNSDRRAPGTRGTSTVPTPRAGRSSSVSFGAPTMCGGSEIKISLSVPARLRLVNSLLRMGMLCRPKIPVKESVSLDCRRPPMRLVSPSRMRSVPLTLRVRKVGRS